MFSVHLLSILLPLSIIAHSLKSQLCTFLPADHKKHQSRHRNCLNFFCEIYTWRNVVTKHFESLFFSSRACVCLQFPIFCSNKCPIFNLDIKFLKNRKIKRHKNWETCGAYRPDTLNPRRLMLHLHTREDFICARFDTI